MPAVINTGTGEIKGSEVSRFEINSKWIVHR
jgi:hypothetical protein